MKNLAGQKFGFLTAIQPNGQRKDRCILWLCDCDCGKQCTVASKCLIDGHTKSCGCSRKLNLVGQKFGRLAVVKRIGKRCDSVDWECLCDCGKTHNVITKYLRGGYVKSCGCLQKDVVSTQGGVWRTPEYRAYMGAKSRCQNLKDKDYSEYGGRGIEFRFKSFPEFLAAIGHRPSPEHSNDRIENDGHYEAGNVMWATRQQQANNRRNSCEALKKTIVGLKARIAELESQLATK